VSRRRPGRQVPPSVIVPFPVKIVCSDRGQHARIVLYRMGDTRSFGIGLLPVPPIGGGRNGLPLAPYMEDGVPRYRIRCPRCRRDLQLCEEKLLAVIDALGPSDGHPVLDIALLPC
jgi:hypothetical protein